VLFRSVTAVMSVFDIQFVLPCVILLGLLAAGRGVYRRYPYYTFAILWFMLALSQIIIFPLPDFFFEHWLYLPVFGFALAVGILFQKFIALKNNRRWFAAGVIGCFMILTNHRAFLWNDSLALTRDVVRQSPNSARAHNNLGHVYYQREDHKNAIHEYRIALTLNPGYSLAANNLASLLAAGGDSEDAVHIFQSIIFNDPRYLDPYINLAQIYQQQGDMVSAFKVYQAALRLDQQSPALHLGLGNYHQLMGRYDLAKREFQRAIWLNPRNVQAFFNLGNAYLAEKNYYEALFNYDKAIDLDPALSQAYINTGYIYFYFNDFKEAVRQFRQALRYDGNQAGGYLNLANALRADGDIEESRLAVERAVALYREAGNSQKADEIQRRLDADDIDGKGETHADKKP
jgi:tetratricopeptide (TPR) repeat protein